LMPVTNPHLDALAETQRAARCMAVCRQCTEVSRRMGIVPFAGTTARERWVVEHCANHPDHDVIRMSGWPPPQVALRRAHDARGTQLACA